MALANTCAGASVPPNLFQPSTSHRTNSLGWAKSDCHTCQSTSRRCDRRRPRCDACTAQGKTCGGYVQQLKWQNRRQKPRSLAAEKTHIVGPESHETPVKTRDYTFVQEDGRKKRQRKLQSSESIFADRQIEKLPPALEIGSKWKKRPPRPGTGFIPVLYSRQPEYFQLPSSILEQLAFFTWRFSPVTLTYNIKANPWQTCVSQIDQAPCLLHAIRALAVRHRAHLEETPESLSVLELKDKALSSFAQSIATAPLEVGISVSLILIGIDFAESAFGNWIVHLRGVYRMIENAGGIKLSESYMHIKAQIAQLVWYDTIVALMSRRGPVFPREYIECVLSWKSDPHWSLLALNGFPDSAFLDMYNVAEAASYASSLSDGDATSLEMKLWLAAFETEQGATDIEFSALTDCWRHGLLLYCTRVFHQRETVKQKAHLLAEEILWLVHQLPPNSSKQKQAALPLFLAACEVESFHLRYIARDFCDRWRKLSGLWLNQTLIELVQIVWAAVDESPGKNVWWGDFVNPSSDSCFLFG
ncbi:MAG: hypothetical protein Q9227_005093 [Pyrenula ochraceoflavens]